MKSKDKSRCGVQDNENKEQIIRSISNKTNKPEPSPPSSIQTSSSCSISHLKNTQKRKHDGSEGNGANYKKSHPLQPGSSQSNEFSLSNLVGYADDEE